MPMTRRPRLAAALLFAALLSVARSAAPAAAEDPKIPFKKYTLPERPRGHPRRRTARVPLVAVNVWYHVGAGDETSGQAAASRTCSST